VSYGEARYGAPNSGKAIAALMCGIVGLTSWALVGIVAIVLVIVLVVLAATS
jgi:hypothetical protein